MHYRKKGYKATFEYKIGDGKSVDVMAERDGRQIAIEIETGKSEYVYNVKKNLDYGFDEIIVAALDGKIKEKIMQELKEFRLDSDGRINVKEIDDILDTYNV